MKNLGLIIILSAFTLNCGIAQKIVVCDNANDFKDNMAAIEINQKWGFIDTLGNVVVTPQYITGTYGLDIPYFSEGLAAVMDPVTREMFYINKNGEKAFQKSFIRAYNFHDGVAFVEPTIFSDSKVLINKKGETIKEIRCSSRTDFSNNRSLLWGQKYIDRHGNYVNKQQYTDARSYSNGLAAVQINYEKWGFIDTLGNVKVPFQFTNEPKPFSDYRAFVLGKNYKWGVIDTTGQLIIEPIYDVVYPYNSGIAVVTKVVDGYKGYRYFIDVNGKVVREFPYNPNQYEQVNVITGFSEGLVAAWKKKQGFIDAEGGYFVI